jgi:hypothetical protein
MSLKDDTDEIRLYNISNPHVQGMLIGYVVKSNVAYVTDLVSPRGPIDRSDMTIAAGDALRKYRISGATIAGGHGTTVKQTEAAVALAAAKKSYGPSLLLRNHNPRTPSGSEKTI